jgi:hypothetical protein
MQNSDFLMWQQGQSTTKLQKKNKPVLANIAELQFRRNDTKLYFKNDHTDTEFIECDFLKRNFKLEIPCCKYNLPKGISRKIKEQIVANLCPFMPSNRTNFWHSLPVCQEITLGVEDSEA